MRMVFKYIMLTITYNGWLSIVLVYSVIENEIFCFDRHKKFFFQNNTLCNRLFSCQRNILHNEAYVIRLVFTLQNFTASNFFLVKMRMWNSTSSMVGHNRYHVNDRNFNKSCLVSILVLAMSLLFHHKKK